MKTLRIKIFALFLSLLALLTSTGIKLYLHQCLTCSEVDTSFIDKERDCYQHHNIHHKTHHSTRDEVADNSGNIHACSTDCCIHIEAFLIYHYINIVERNIAQTLKFVLQTDSYASCVTKLDKQVEPNSYLEYNYLYPPPLIISGFEVLKTIHQLKIG